MPYNPNYRIAFELYLIRHGLSESNAGTAGESIEESQDSHLAESGLRQAELLGERFADCKLDCIISSGLKRAVETALPIAANQHEGGAKTVEIHPLFSEVGINEEYKGKTFEELKTEYPDIIIAPGAGEYERLLCHTAGGITSKQRAREAVEYLKSRFKNGEKAAVVSHGGFNRYILEYAMNIDFEFAGTDPTFFNTGVTKINFYVHGEGIYGNDVNLVYMNDHSHLADEMPRLSFDKA